MTRRELWKAFGGTATVVGSGAVATKVVAKDVYHPSGPQDGQNLAEWIVRHVSVAFAEADFKRLPDWSNLLIVRECGVWLRGFHLDELEKLEREFKHIEAGTVIPDIVQLVKHPEVAFALVLPAAIAISEKVVEDCKVYRSSRIISSQLPEIVPGLGAISHRFVTRDGLLVRSIAHYDPRCLGLSMTFDALYRLRG